MNNDLTLLEGIEKRRSVRSYQDKPVSNDLIRKILNFGILAPSAKNKQPWNFIVIQDNKELKDKIADLMIEKAHLSNKIDPTIIATANTIKEAPVLILVFNKFKEEHFLSNTLSIGACIENMLLAATYFQIGSLWIGNTYIAENEIRTMFNKKEMSLAAAVALGYSFETPNARPRIALEEIMEWK